MSASKVKKKWIPAAMVGGLALGLGGTAWAAQRRAPAPQAVPAGARLPAARGQRIAEAAGLPVAWAQAIAEVESAGADRAVRFEVHLAVRRVPALQGPDAARPWEGAAVPWTPVDPTTGRLFDLRSARRAETDRAAFDRAWAEVDAREPAGEARHEARRALVRATSWGRFQVLGGHLLAIEADPKRAVYAFDRSPAEISDQLLVRWLQATPEALEAVRRGDARRFVELYNGSANVAVYLPRLERALQRHAVRV